MEQKNSAGIDTHEIDFDTWSELARTDPERFEALRLAAIERVIAGAPVENRDRLRRLQWRIDQERRLARTPLAACMRISRMMWKAVLGRGGLQQRIGELQQFDGTAPVELAPARVVAFARQRD
jgi:hypothetical protein